MSGVSLWLHLGGILGVSRGVFELSLWAILAVSGVSQLIFLGVSVLSFKVLDYRLGVYWVSLGCPQ